MQKGFLLCAVILVACLVGGCGSKANSPRDGALKNDVYTNRFFGFQVRVPDTWTVLKQPSRSELRQGAEAFLGGDKRAAAAATSAASRQVHYLLLARNVVIGRSVAILAKGLKDAPEIQTGKDYLQQSLKVITGPDKPFQQLNQIAPVKLASREFYRLELVTTLYGEEMRQNMYVTLEKGHALYIAVAARSQAGIEQTLIDLGLADEETAPATVSVEREMPIGSD